MRLVAQGDGHAGGQRPIHMLVDDPAAHPHSATEGAEILSGMVTEQNLGSLHLAQRRGARGRQSFQLLSLLRGRTKAARAVVLAMPNETAR